MGRDENNWSEEGNIMKIATYNIWNSEAGMFARKKAIQKEILDVGADVICLQEVEDCELAEMIAGQTGLKFLFFQAYETGNEGLCIVSKIPLDKRESWCHDVNAIYADFYYQARRVAIVNLHLPWDSVWEREQQIMEVVSRINEHSFDIAFLLGDFIKWNMVFHCVYSAYS